jgi:hypothetical protein
MSIGRRSTQAGVGVALSLALGGLSWAWLAAPAARGAGLAPHTVSVSVGGPLRVQSIPDGFAGLSLEYTTLPDYAGEDPGAVDPVFEQLVRNISPGQRPVIRLGGDTTDWTWWPVPGWKRPPWVRFTLDANWMAVTRSLAEALHARLLPGLNLEANSRAVAAAEARAMLSGLGRNAIEGFELGNEPELYAAFAWYRTGKGRPVRGRARGYDFAKFARDFRRVAAGVPRSISLTGPGTGGGPKWTDPLASFLKQEPRVRIVTLHRYGVDGCSRLVPLRSLLSTQAQQGLAMSVAPETRLAHAHHIKLRVEEMNTVGCGGQLGVSNTFAAALWLLDTLFETARVGVDGVNIHTNPPGANVAASPQAQAAVIHNHKKSPGLNSLFSFDQVGGRWYGSVRPEYYGMLMFSQAAPAGSRLLRVTQPSDTAGLHIWATRAPNRVVHVVLINENWRKSFTARVKLHRSSPATLERLSASRLSATSGTTLGGQGFGQSTATGRLDPARLLTVASRGGVYTVRVPAASAALLTVQGRP